MTFQFYCPQSHLLEGDETLAGGQLTCPICQTLFIVPAPPPASPWLKIRSLTNAFPAIQTDFIEPPVTPGVAVDEAPEAAEPEVEAEPEEDPNRVVRVICPEGHELHTPMHMIGQDAMCPHCETQFQLRYEDSLEYKEEQEIRRQEREEAFNASALKWAIVAAVLVGIGLITMVVLAIVQ